jgi:hypothetical protein
MELFQMTEKTDRLKMKRLMRKLRTQETSKRLNTLLGFRGKTLWDLLQLFIIPAFITGFALWFNRNESIRQEDISLDRQREEALQAYFSAMEYLLLDKQLRSSDVDSEVRAVARARTLATLYRLDGERKGQLLNFLYESNLINVGNSIIVLEGAALFQADLEEANLEGADLSGANLANANLDEVNLKSADLSDSRLSGASLRFAKLSGADLSNARFGFADLWRADLSGVDLSNANFDSAILWDVDLSDANLMDADFYGADLSRADLSGTNLSGTDFGDAQVTEEQLSEASLFSENTILPDGTRYDGRFDR